MKPLSIVAALAAGAVGALAWALIAWQAHFEIGYLAWGIGLLVGIASHKLGGSGTANGILCAIIVLLSIFAGKVVAIKFGLPKKLSKLHANNFYHKRDTKAR